MPSQGLDILTDTLSSLEISSQGNMSSPPLRIMDQEFRCPQGSGRGPGRKWRNRDTFLVWSPQGSSGPADVGIWEYGFCVAGPSNFSREARENALQAKYLGAGPGLGIAGLWRLVAVLSAETMKHHFLMKWAILPRIRIRKRKNPKHTVYWYSLYSLPALPLTGDSLGLFL